MTLKLLDGQDVPLSDPGPVILAAYEVFADSPFGKQLVHASGSLSRAVEIAREATIASGHTTHVMGADGKELAGFMANRKSVETPKSDAEIAYKRYPNKCPGCGADLDLAAGLDHCVEYTPGDFSHSLTINRSCDSCGREWSDEYVFHRSVQD